MSEQLYGESSHLPDHQVFHSPEKGINEVRTNFFSPRLYPSECNRYDENLMVLTGIEVTESYDGRGFAAPAAEDLTLSWAEGKAICHAALYKAAGKSDHYSVNLPLGSSDELIKITARYDEQGNLPRLLFYFQSAKSQLEAQLESIMKILQESEEETLRHFGWGEDVQMETGVYHRETYHETWKRVLITDEHSL